MCRLVNVRNHVRPPFPLMTSGKEREFDQLGMLAAKGPYLQSQRMAWAPFFATNRWVSSGSVAIRHPLSVA